MQRECEIVMVLKNDLLDRLVKEASRRKMKPVELMADLVETIINEDLFVAILDN